MDRNKIRLIILGYTGRAAYVVATAESDPHVWSGRASQGVFIDLSALPSCINVSGLGTERFILRAIMEGVAKSRHAGALERYGRDQVGRMTSAAAP